MNPLLPPTSTYPLIDECAFIWVQSHLPYCVETQRVLAMVTALQGLSPQVVARPPLGTGVDPQQHVERSPVSGLWRSCTGSELDFK